MRFNIDVGDYWFVIFLISAAILISLERGINLYRINRSLLLCGFKKCAFKKIVSVETIGIKTIMHLIPGDKVSRVPYLYAPTHCLGYPLTYPSVSRRLFSSPELKAQDELLLSLLPVHHPSVCTAVICPHL